MKETKGMYMIRLSLSNTMDRYIQMIEKLN